MTTPRDLAIEVLTEALQSLDHGPDGAEYSHTYTVDSPEAFAAAIIDASPRLASMLLTGAAVEMLLNSHIGGDWELRPYAAEDGGHVVLVDTSEWPSWEHEAPTFSEVITKALERKP